MTLVHVGHAKTGSTWVQQHLLPRHRELERPLSNLALIDRLVVPHDLHFEPDPVRNEFTQLRDRLRSQGRVMVLSSERLCGHPYTGGRDSVRLAERVERTVPDARIWILIRRQVDVITSIYKHYIRENGTGTVERFLGDEPPIGVPGFRFLFYEYQHLIRHYRSRFGADRVLVTPYEDLRSDPAKVINAVSRFAGVGPPGDAVDPSERLNVSLSDLSCLILRPLNVLSYHPYSGQHPVVELPGRRAIRRTLEWLDARGWGRFLDDPIRERVAGLVQDRFRDANRDLQDLLEVDLAARGYAL